MLAFVVVCHTKIWKGVEVATYHSRSGYPEIQRPLVFFPQRFRPNHAPSVPCKRGMLLLQRDGRKGAEYGVLSATLRYLALVCLYAVLLLAVACSYTFGCCVVWVVRHLAP